MNCRGLYRVGFTLERLLFICSCSNFSCVLEIRFGALNVSRTSYSSEVRNAFSIGELKFGICRK